MIKSRLKVGDIVWIEPLNQLVEILGCLPNEGKIHYWTSANPGQAETRRCSEMSAWIAFRHGVKLGSTQPTTNNFRQKVGLK